MKYIDPEYIDPQTLLFKIDQLLFKENYDSATINFPNYQELFIKNSDKVFKRFEPTVTRDLLTIGIMGYLHGPNGEAPKQIKISKFIESSAIMVDKDMITLNVTEYIKNGVKVRIERHKDRGSVVIADCECFGISGRVHSTEFCPNRGRCKMASKKKFKKFSCGCFLKIEDNYDDAKADQLYLPPNNKFELIINYPLSHPARININTGKTGMRFIGLVKKIKKAYHKIYEQDDKDPDLYGIYGHSIDDLMLEGIEVDFIKKRITLSIGS
jgi:hypothetical protein